MTEDRRHHDSIRVDVTPEQLWDLVSDITRTGEWSPICKSCWWVEGDGPVVGARFVGHNETPDRTWETTSTVTEAERGVEFGWQVGEAFVHWRYTFEPEDGGTRLTEWWHFRPEGFAMFAQQLRRRRAEPDRDPDARGARGDSRDLAAIKRIAEAG